MGFHGNQQESEGWRHQNWWDQDQKSKELCESGG
jgi:hypothetical protein